MARNVKFELRRGAGSSLEVLYGKVSLRPTLMHNVASSVVLPAPTTFDLVQGVAIATNVAPSPEPVDGMVEWAYVVKVEDNHGKTFEFMVGVPDGTTEINFNELPRYFETKPPLFGRGPQGIPGEAATIAIGTTTSGPTPAVTNTGTSTDAVLDFTLAQGPQGPKGDGVVVADTLFTDLPASYAAGTTIGNSVTTNGWPMNFATVETVRRGAGRVVQSLTNTANTIHMQRTESGGVWTVFRDIAYGDLASPLMNGLMPALDKAKLDGMTPAANSKTFAAMASTYQAGFSVLQVRAADGWPIATTGTVVTQKTATGNGGVAQWLYPVEGGAPQYRVSNAAGNWLSFETVATESSVAARTGFVRPEDFGAVGDGVADDSSAIESAINANLESGRTVVFDPAKNYRVTRTITNTAPVLGSKYSVNLSSLNDTPATITVEGALTGILVRGAIVASTTLSAPTYLQQRAWAVTSAAGAVPGSLIQVIGSPSWYYDPRPESTDTRISELQRVSHVEGTTIYTEAPANDGYRPTDGTVTVNIINPVKSSITNINVVRADPLVGSDATIGLRVDLADDAVVSGVTIRNSTGAGISYRNSYAGEVSNCKIFGANNWSQGYGISVPGCSYTFISRNYIATSRRSVDVTSARQTVSRYVRVEFNSYVGGGKSSQGLWFGWNPATDALESRNGGFGCHGGADSCTFDSNLTMNCVEPYVVRGANPTFTNNTHIGRTDVAVFGVAEGGGIATIQGNRALSGWLGTTKYQYQANARRANTFVKTYDSFVPAQGRLIVTDNYAEVTSTFALFGTISPPSAALPVYVSIRGNRVGFSDNTAGPGVLLRNPSGTLVNAGVWWSIGPNEYISDTKVTAPKLTESINLNGAKVLDYTTSGPTT